MQRYSCKCNATVELCSMNSKPIWGMYLNNDPSSRTSESAHIIIKVASQIHHLMAMASLDWEGEDEKIAGEEGVKSTISSDVRDDSNGICLTRLVLNY